MGEGIDMDHLLDALENETNASIMNLTTRKIKEYKNTILQQLQLPRGRLKQYHKKLKHYRYCSDLSHIQYGYYIRWIPLKDPTNLYLTNGGIICDIQVINEQVHVRCFNRYRKIMQIKLDECYIFQKLSDEERVILNVLDYLAK